MTRRSREIVRSTEDEGLYIKTFGVNGAADVLSNRSSLLAYLDVIILLSCIGVEMREIFQSFCQGATGTTMGELSKEELSWGLDKEGKFPLDTKQKDALHPCSTPHTVDKPD